MSEADRKICAMAAEHCSVEEYYENKAVFTHHFNRQKVTDMLDELAAKDKRIEELEASLRLTLSFCPSGYVPSGLDPTFYHTLNYEKEVELHIRLDAAMELLK